MAKERNIGGRCNGCIHWVEIPEKTFVGECRRYPPKPQEKLKHVVWPVTNDYDWCGEYESKD